MKPDLVKEKLKKIIPFLRESWFRFNLRPGDIMLYVITTAVSAMLVGSIYSSINDIQKYKIAEAEQGVLDELKESNQELLRERNYYKSSFYRRMYARESHSLAKENQDIFFVDRSTRASIERIEENRDPIRLENVRFWWINLIF